MSKSSTINNLNKSFIPDDSPNSKGVPIENPTCTSGPITVYFRDAMEQLAKRIKEADYVFGCVAWLTNERILNALSEAKGVAVVVAKEDWLRPDIDQYQSVKNLYNTLKPMEWSLRSLPFLDTSLRSVSMCSSIGYNDTVRCFGNFNSEKKLAWPRLHHKFLVFGNYNTETESINPYGVWTGSLNLTHNSEQSLENGMFILDSKLANAFSKEFTQIYAMSEGLDWNHIYTAPEYRIGT